MAERREISKTLTLLLVFVITVIAVVLIFAYFTNVLKFGMPSKDVSVDGVMTVTGGGGPSATLIFTMTNLSKSSVVGATFTCPASSFASTDCGGLQLTSGGVPVSSQNPVIDHGTATASSTVTSAGGTNFVAAQSYTLIVTFYFADGTSLTLTEVLPAQA